MQKNTWNRSLAFAIIGVVGLPAAALTQDTSPQVTVSGVVYAHFVYQLKDSANDNSFDVDRWYVNVLGKFGSEVGTRVTVDVNSPAGDNSLRFRLKYAYVTYTPKESALTGKFGLIHTPWVDWEEGLWGYRMQGPIAVDRNGKLTSSDFGVGVDGHWGTKAVNMQVTFVNGEGYSGGPGDQHKDIEGRVSVRLLKTDDMGSRGGLRLTGYVGYGKPTGGTRERFVGMASYKSKRFTLAGELAATKDSTTSPEATGRIITGFGVFNVSNSKLAVIGRVDLYDPNTDTPDDAQTTFIAGVSYQVSPNVRALVDLDHTQYQTDAANDANPGRSRALFQIQFTF